MINTKTVCIICREDGSDIENNCNYCKSANMHRECFNLTLKNQINKCPICREKFDIYRDNNIINIDIDNNNLDIENDNRYISIKNIIFNYIHSKINYIIDSSVCKCINITFIILIFLFVIYLVFGFIACIANNDFPNIFSLKYLEYFGFLCLELLIIASFFTLLHGLCCTDHFEPYN